MRGDSLVLHELPEQLVVDWYNLLIFTEYDMQVATYYWLRREFERVRSDRWTVRTQPTLDMGSGNTIKPDVVVFKNSVPYDVFELKCHLDGVRETLLDDDLEKLGVSRPAGTSGMPTSSYCTTTKIFGALHMIESPG